MQTKTVLFRADQLIFREGEAGDCAYLINSGSVDISIKKDDEVIRIDRLLAGQIFGELALFDTGPRSATATTATGCELSVISKDFFDREIEALDPFLRYWVVHATRLNRSLLTRTDPSWSARPVKDLVNAAVLGPLRPAPAPKLVETVWLNTRQSQIYDRRLFYAGQTIFKEGDEGGKAFMIRSGLVRIVKGVIGEPKTLSEMGPGQVFGEFALVDEQPRSATALAVADTEVLVVDGFRFRSRLANQSRFMQHWIKLITARLRSLSERVKD